MKNLAQSKVGIKAFSSPEIAWGGSLHPARQAAGGN
jgi:hypothetical protein